MRSRLPSRIDWRRNHSIWHSIHARLTFWISWGNRILLTPKLSNIILESIFSNFWNSNSKGNQMTYRQNFRMSQLHNRLFSSNNNSENIMKLKEGAAPSPQSMLWIQPKWKTNPISWISKSNLFLLYDLLLVLYKFSVETPLHDPS